MCNDLLNHAHTWLMWICGFFQVQCKAVKALGKNFGICNLFVVPQKLVHASTVMIRTRKPPGQGPITKEYIAMHI